MLVPVPVAVARAFLTSGVLPGAWKSVVLPPGSRGYSQAWSAGLRSRPPPHRARLACLGRPGRPGQEARGPPGKRGWELILPSLSILAMFE